MTSKNTKPDAARQRLRISFGLRLLLMSFVFVTILVASSSLYASRCEEQRNCVHNLTHLCGDINLRFWYDDEVVWDANTECYGIVLSTGEKAGVTNWIEQTFGRDYLHSPVVLEIDGNFFGDSEIRDKIVNQVRRIQSIKQIWLSDLNDGDNEQVNEAVNSTLRQLLPELIVENHLPYAR